MPVMSARFVLPVADMERAIAFYRDGLGLQVLLHAPHRSELDCLGARIVLEPGASDARRETGLAIEVDDLEIDVASAFAAGAVIEKPPHDAVGDHLRRAQIRDTEGNVITLVQPLMRWAEGKL
jgi:predicted enzyme related to lactoylglutathione lyase